MASKLPYVGRGAFDSGHRRVGRSRPSSQAGGLIVIQLVSWTTGSGHGRAGKAGRPDRGGRSCSSTSAFYLQFLPAAAVDGRLPGLSTPPCTQILTILIVVVTINAVNFIDGLDGLAAGDRRHRGDAYFLFYYTLTKVSDGRLTGRRWRSAVLAGVCMGFLPHNFYPAKIFMGDTGAMLLGLLLAYAPISSLCRSTRTLTIAATRRSDQPVPVLPLLLPAAVMLIPYADLMLAVVRRTRAGLSPFAADKGTCTTGCWRSGTRTGPVS